MNEHKLLQKISIVIIAAFIGIVGCIADFNFLRFELSDSSSTNYQFQGNDRDNMKLVYSVNFPFKSDFVYLNGAIRSLLHQPEMNGVVKLNNGHLIIPISEYDDDKINEMSNQVIGLSDYCKNKGIPFLYVQPTMNIDENNPQLPTGYYDYRNENTDKLISNVMSSNVNVMDIRKLMTQDGMDMYDYTYRTDHHWNARGAFYAFQHIASWIGDVTGKEIAPEIVNTDDYKLLVYKGSHLGSRGKSTGVGYAGCDDFEIMDPLYNVTLQNTTNDETGTFEDIVIRKSIFEKIDLSQYIYDLALNNDWKTVSETKNVNILMVSNSYANLVVPYMKMGYSQCNFVYCDGDVYSSSINNANPDVVIFMPYVIDSKFKFILQN